MKTVKKPVERVWDRHSIKAEIYRRGKTMEELAGENGMSGSYVRRALREPCKRANHAIAKFLKVDVHQLWPNWFYPDGELIPLQHRQRLNTGFSGFASAESRAA